MKMLINSMDELKKFIPRLSLKEFSSAEEFLTAATIEHIIPAICPEKHKELVESAESPERTAAQRALAYYFAFEYTRAGGIAITPQGIQQMETASNKTATYGDKMDMLNFYAEKADLFLDILLDMLHIQPLAASLIPSSAILQRFIPVGRSLRTLAALQPAIHYAEQFSILPIVGAEKMAELRINSTDKEAKSEMLLNVQGALACLALANSISQLTIRYKDGIIGVASYYSPSERDRVALSTTLAGIKEMAQANASAYLNALQKQVNIGNADTGHTLTNTAESKHFVPWY